MPDARAPRIGVSQPIACAKTTLRCDLRGQRQREHVEEYVAARGAARRVALGDAEAGYDRLPPPGADRGAVELERGDDDEDPCVDGATSGDERRRQRSAADRAGEIRRRQHRQPRDAPAGDADRCRRDQPASCATGGLRQREPGQVDEPVTGWHVGGKVPKPVLVDAPEQRPDDLAARSDGDDEQRLQPDRGRLEPEQATEHGCGADAERELQLRSSVPLRQQGREDPQRGDGDREQGAPGHRR
jgi:hypothetical protein